MSLRAPRLLPREHGWIETNRGLERGHRLITYTMRPDRQIPAHAALWEIRGDRLVWLASAYRSDPPNTREALLREWVTAEPVGPRYVDANRQHGVSLSV